MEYDNIFNEDGGILDLNAVSMDELDDDILEMDHINEFSLYKPYTQTNIGLQLEQRSSASSESMRVEMPESMQIVANENASPPPMSVTSSSPASLNDTHLASTVSTPNSDTIALPEDTPDKKHAAEYAQRIIVLKQRFDVAFEAFHAMNSKFAQVVYGESKDQAALLNLNNLAASRNSSPTLKPSPKTSPLSNVAKSKRKFDTIMSPVTATRISSSPKTQAAMGGKVSSPNKRALSSQEVPKTAQKTYASSAKRTAVQPKQALGSFGKSASTPSSPRKPASTRTSPTRSTLRSKMPSGMHFSKKTTGLPTPSASSPNLFSGEVQQKRLSPSATSLRQLFGPAAAVATAQANKLPESWANLRSGLPVPSSHVSMLRPPSTRIPKIVSRASSTL